MKTVETILALGQAAERLGLLDAFKAIWGEAAKTSPELAAAPPPSAQAEVNATVDAELAALGHRRG